MRAVKIFFLASSLPLSLPLALVRSTFFFSSRYCCILY